LVERAKPIVTVHEGIHVVRDDLYPGGTKARFLPVLFENADEVVYASPAQGGAQVALAFVAKQLGKRATIFVARRHALHPRTMEVKRLGAKVVQVDNGYLNVVQARAKAYCKTTGASLAPFGVDMPQAINCIAEDAMRIGIQPDEVWCAASSGTLARSLAKAFPHAQRHAVQVGRDVEPSDTDGAILHVYPRDYDWTPNAAVAPFPGDAHYELKAWEVCRARHGPGTILFWNVVGPPQNDQ
jgi:1-aminocyclopropane-1-carboxylate deaminase/D-cysteine desulfhydrase-like pyridoxal-dependent ACC family enzyme